MIDPATGWLKIVRYNDKYTDIIENLEEKTCLSRNPRPTVIMYNYGNKLLGHACKNDTTRK